jgi:hypothetical protein
MSLEVSGDVSTISFNSATTFQPWKQEDTEEYSEPEPAASIRPRLFSRGNSKVLHHEQNSGKELQFGHDFSAVET